MEIIVLFGLPGAGKTFVGKILEKDFGYYFYDGDQDMSNEYKDAIVNETVTDDQRQNFFNRLIGSIKRLQQPKIVLAQTFIKDKYRVQFLKAFPKARFVLLQALTKIREQRLLFRDKFELPLEKWRRMSSVFETPEISHVVIINNLDGEEEIKKQLQLIIRQS